MKMRPIQSLTMLALMMAMSTFFACDSGGGDVTEGVDKLPMLSNVGPNLIIPSYEALANASVSMNTAANAFTQDPTAANLSNVRSQWKAAYLAWQACSPFSFGPADAVGLQNSVNVFPTDATLIESNISNGNFNLDALSNVDAKGFPALDYLLYGTGSNDDEIVAYFSGSENARTYLTTLTAAIESITAQVSSEWKSSGGNYIADFLSQTGTDQGSSLGQMVNKMSEDYEINKNFKLGLPAGIKTVGNDVFPDKVEGYYSGISLELMKANFQASERVFLGNSLSGNAGEGIDDLLVAYGAEALTTDINNQFTSLYTALDKIPAPFSQVLETNQAEVQQAYDEAQSMVVLIKTELPSVLGVQISYQDQDND